MEPKERMDAVKGGLVNIQRGRGELPDLRTLGRVQYSFHFAGRQQRHVRLLARVAVGRENASNISAYRKRKLAE